ncbi:MAG: hypothetical protein PHS44_08340, partial [Candidatus Dojkabacteria bacterium]|nr:hypothetical protein [Candidatus Dojkabacteria bacterium]
MNNYEILLEKAVKENIHVYESFDLNGDNETQHRIDGLYIDRNIALDKEVKTGKEKSCILAEELGHYYTTVGDITDQTKVENRKQELRARMWAYNDRIGLMGL